MKVLKGTIYQGKITLDEVFMSDKPLRVTISVETEEDKGELQIKDFSFLNSQEMLKGCSSSFSDEVINERREE